MSCESAFHEELGDLDNEQPIYKLSNANTSYHICVSFCVLLFLLSFFFWGVEHGATVFLVVSRYSHPNTRYPRDRPIAHSVFSVVHPSQNIKKEQGCYFFWVPYIPHQTKGCTNPNTADSFVSTRTKNTDQLDHERQTQCFFLHTPPPPPPKRRNNNRK